MSDSPAAPRAIDWFKYGSPEAFFPIAGKLIPWFASAALALCAVGLYLGFFGTVPDVRQGEAYRIVFLHEPAAWLSLFLYFVMAFWAALGLVSGTRLPAMLASALAPTGALFTFFALWTGALWGRPTWGTWWVWDARLTAEWVLLFFYLGFMALDAAIDEPRRADRGGAALVLAGAASVPLVYFSVRWWNALDQVAVPGLRGAPMEAGAMLDGMLVLGLGFWAYSLTAAMLRVRCVLLERERHTEWVRDYAEQRS